MHANELNNEHFLPFRPPTSGQPFCGTNFPNSQSLVPSSGRVQSVSKSTRMHSDTAWRSFNEGNRKAVDTLWEHWEKKCQTLCFCSVARNHKIIVALGWQQKKDVGRLKDIIITFMFCIEIRRHSFRSVMQSVRCLLLLASRSPLDTLNVIKLSVQSGCQNPFRSSVILLLFPAPSHSTASPQHLVLRPDT